VPPSEGVSPGGDAACCAFAAADIEAAHATLRARGAEVDTEIARAGTSRSGLVDRRGVEDPVPPQFFVRDPDGNRFPIVQPAPAASSTPPA
jgi:catechol 2,3-dioxygenase-like lactoylglutathione lyase family enzyme